MYQSADDTSRQRVNEKANLHALIHMWITSSDSVVIEDSCI